MTAESIQNTNFGLRDFYVILSHLSIKNNDCRIHPKYEFRTHRFLCNFESFIHKKTMTAESIQNTNFGVRDFYVF